MAECSVKTVSNSSNLSAENNSGESTEQTEEEKTDPVMDNKRLEDYEPDKPLPASLENLLKHLEGEALDAADIIAVFVYIFMLETGFVPVGYVSPGGASAYKPEYNHSRILLLTQSMPADWRCNEGYKMNFVLVAALQYIARISILRADGDLIINCTVRQLPDDNLSLLIDPLQYVVTRNRFQCMRELSIKFKDEISVPLRNNILEENSLRSYSFPEMPPELICKILSFCDERTMDRLRETCKHFKHFKYGNNEVHMKFHGRRFCFRLPKRMPKKIRIHCHF